MLNVCVELGETQLLVLSTSGLILRILDPGTKFKIRLVSVFFICDLEWKTGVQACVSVLQRVNFERTPDLSLGFRGLEFRVWGLGFRVYGPGPLGPFSRSFSF